MLFFLWPHPFLLSGVISLLIPSSILGTYRPGEFLFQCPIILPSHTAHGVSRREYWSGLPFPSPAYHVLSELSTMTRPAWVALHHMAHSFIELDKAVVRWSDWLVFWDYGLSVSALWCPLATPTVLLGFLLPWTWGTAPAKRSHCSLPWTRPPLHVECWTWSSSSQPSCACATAAPWTWGSSSPPPPLTSDMG